MRLFFLCFFTKDESLLSLYGSDQVENYRELNILLEKEKESKLKNGTLVVAIATFIAESSDVGPLL